MAKPKTEVKEPEAVPAKESKSYTLVIVVAVAIVAAALISGAVTAYLLQQPEPATTVEPGDPTLSFGSLSGDIFFTLTHIPEGETAEPVLASYTNNTSGQDLIRRFTDLTDHRITQLNFSPNGRYATFIAVNKNLIDGDSVIEADDSYALQVFRADLANSTLEEAIANAEQVTDMQAANKSNPSINNKGEILFTSRGEGTNVFNTEPSELAADWTIHYISKEGIISEEAEGFYPQWLGEGSFLYLAEGTIYLQGIGAFSRTAVADEEDMQYTSFNVSDDRSVLVATAHNDAEVLIFRLSVQEGELQTEQISRHSGVAATWPLVSPDNQYVGLFDTNLGKYVVYDVGTAVPASRSIDLRGFDMAEVRVTDWR